MGPDYAQMRHENAVKALTCEHRSCFQCCGCDLVVCSNCMTRLPAEALETKELKTCGFDCCDCFPVRNGVPSNHGSRCTCPPDIVFESGETDFGDSWTSFTLPKPVA